MTPLVSAFLALAPVFAKLLDGFLKTPEEKRGDFIEKTHQAFEKAKLTGDTSGIEEQMEKS